MRIALGISIDATGFDIGADSPAEARRALAGNLRLLADRVERTNDDKTMVELRDEMTDVLLGHLMLNIKTGTAR